MSLFSRTVSWFGSVAGAPRLVVDGQQLWWPKESLPLNVWMDWGLAEAARPVELFSAMMAIPGGNLQWPVDLEAETRNVFFGSRLTFRSAIVIQPYLMTPSPGGFKCNTDIERDRRSGEIRNALVLWNLAPNDPLGNRARLMHELGHCLGLGHCDGTVMQAQVRDWTGLRGFNEAQTKYLKGLRA